MADRRRPRAVGVGCGPHRRGPAPPAQRRDGRTRPGRAGRRAAHRGDLPDRQPQRAGGPHPSGARVRRPQRGGRHGGLGAGRPALRRRGRQPRAGGLMSVVDSVVETAAEAWEDTRVFLASPRGQDVRRKVAAVVIVATPLVTDLPVLRRTLLGRALRYAAVGALMIKGAEWLRDWDPHASTVSTPGRTP